MNRVILTEGLPGTGKTTNSYKLFEQLVRSGWDVRWLHEVSQPHPTLFFSESCLTKEEYRLFTEKYPEAADMLGSITEVRETTVGIAHQDAPSCKAKDGMYVNAATGAFLSIKDGILTDPEGTKRRLSPKSPTEFFMEGLPESLLFRQLEDSHTHGLVRSRPQFLSAYPKLFSGETVYRRPLKVTVPAKAVFIPSACLYMAKASAPRIGLLATYPTIKAICL